MKNIYKYLLLLFLVKFFLPVAAQGNFGSYVPSVGESVRDYEFTFVDNYPTSSFKVSDFRGKWVILDFWSYGCAGCIASFPKMNDIHKRFKDKVQLVMVGLDSPKFRSKTLKLFKDRKKQYDLEFTMALDSNASKFFNIQSVPYILVIDPEGVIRAKTVSISEKDVEEFLKGDLPQLRPAYSGTEKEEIGDRYISELPLLTNGLNANGGKADSSFLFRSLLTTYSKGMSSVITTLFSERSPAVAKGKVELSGVSLAYLYRTAYFGSGGWSMGFPQYGKYSWPIELHLRDSSSFIYDRATLKGHYTYSLIVPKNRSNLAYLKKLMQADLERYFNYDVSVEKRLKSAFQLRIKDPVKVAKIRSNESRFNRDHDNDKYSYWNFRDAQMRDIMLVFTLSLPHVSGEEGNGTEVIIDKTGIDYPVNMNIKADFLDWKSVDKSLAKYGLTIEPIQLELETLVIRDKSF